MIFNINLILRMRIIYSRRLEFPSAKVVRLRMTGGVLTKRLWCGAVALMLALSMGCEGNKEGTEPGAAAKASAPAQTKTDEAKADEAEADEREKVEADVKKGPRIVTLGGTASEVVFALGHGDEVVGVDASSSYPEEVNSRTKLGYFRKVSPEGVLALNPTLVIAQHGVGPENAIEQIRKAGVTFEVLPEAKDLETAIVRIERMGEMLGEKEKAAALITTLRADVDKATKQRDASKVRPKALFIYARGIMTFVMGKGTSAAAMLELAGIENAADVEQYKPLTPEAVIAAAPEMLILPAKGAKSVGGEDGVFKLPGVAQTPAGKSRKLVLIDDLMLLGFGPRFGKALLEMQAKSGIADGGD